MYNEGPALDVALPRPLHCLIPARKALFAYLGLPSITSHYTISMTGKLEPQCKPSRLPGCSVGRSEEEGHGSDSTCRPEFPVKSDLHVLSLLCTRNPTAPVIKTSQGRFHCTVPQPSWHRGDHMIFVCCKAQMRIAEIRGSLIKPVKKYLERKRICCFTDTKETPLLN